MDINTLKMCSIDCTLLQVVWPQNGYKEEIIDLSELKSKFNGCFTVNNSTICYVSDRVYVTPYTRESYSSLVEAGFKPASFYVPLSNGEYPKENRHIWEKLLAKAEESRQRDYEDDCKNFCFKNGIKPLSEETMAGVFAIPHQGVPVSHMYFQNRYYPICNERVCDCITCDNLGTYCANNGRVVFVYINGYTYVAKGYKIINELNEAGFRQKGLFVPFSNGETITDIALASLWERIPKR